ncbi:MAG: hypothetical protein LQ340_001774 [Diploschistes diacapsis]|nr:MAG: hypothetical protein LQ340_001774 [Diploschistes diacapsis]
MAFGRMVHVFLPDRQVAKVKAKRLTLIFVMLDAVTFQRSGWGGMMMSSTDPNTVRRSPNIYMAGIGAQLLFSTALLGLTVHFYQKANRAGNRRSTDWRCLPYLINAEYALIAIRIIFRLISSRAASTDQ